MKHQFKKITITTILFSLIFITVLFLGGYYRDMSNLGMLDLEDLLEIITITLVFHVPMTLFIFFHSFIDSRWHGIWSRAFIFLATSFFIVLILPIESRGGSMNVFPDSKVLYLALIVIGNAFISALFTFLALIVFLRERK